MLSGVLDEIFDSPDTSGVPLFRQLGPDGAGAVGGGIGNVNSDGALVRLVDNVISAVVVIPLCVTTCWRLSCKSIQEEHEPKVILSPADTETLEGAATLAALQMMSVELTSFTGLLLGGERM